MPYIAQQVVAGLTRPVFACAPPGDHTRLFILEQAGRIRIVDLTAQPATLKPIPFLSIPGLPNGNEQGLLGMAFHPNYASNGNFFVNFTDAAGDTIIARFTRSTASPDIADPASKQIVLKVDQPFANHNGGWLAFGPDGFLYIALGDGGSSNDPQNNAQNLGQLLGKLLRIDVRGDDFPTDPDRNYAIPATNPFVSVPNARKEIWASGLRNPWRCAFDRATGQLYIADVGQDEFEEVNVQPAGQGGQNYGWRLREGNHDTGLGSTAGLVLTAPVHEYDHAQGLAIVGGYVYRGTSIPELVGRYFFADFTGTIWSFQWNGTVASNVVDETATLFPAGGPSSITSFGEDASGAIYLLNRSPGILYRIEPAAVPAIPAVNIRLAAIQVEPPATPSKGVLRSLRWTPSLPPPAAALIAGEVAARAAPGEGPIFFPLADGTPVEQARTLLQAAAEIEHSLLVQYLYAAYSIDPKSQSEGELKTPLINIAVQEMGHLATVQNLLLAIGGRPYYGRVSAQGEHDPFAFHLQPLSVTSLAKYVNAESPLPEQLTQYPDLLRRAMRAYGIAALALEPAGGGTGPSIKHVGALYGQLYILFKSSQAPEGPWNLPDPGTLGHLLDGDFSGIANPQQISTDEIINTHSEPVYSEDGAYLKQIASRADALEAIHFIGSEGEGWVENPAQHSHFERFLDMFEAFVRLQESGVEPVLPVPTDPQIGDGTEYHRISHPTSKLWAELSDLRYQILVGELWLATLLSPTGAPDDLRKELFQKRIVREMRVPIARIATKLALLPRVAPPSPVPPGVPPAASTAGAPFQLPDPASLPADIAGWKQFLKDRFVATAAVCAKLDSAENTLGLTTQDKTLLMNLQTGDQQLAALLGP